MNSLGNGKCVTSSPSSDESLCKKKNRGRKRRRINSDGSDIEDGLPDNAMELEKNLHISAVKNNLDDVSIKKILRKVVKNDHVLALVKLKEEEENSTVVDPELKPKLTRAKVKELMKVSPKSAPWDLENLELTPIKHIPVKTRPEVKALIAHELPEDEDDEEYEPTNDDVPSDDDHTMESSSDVESQPRTPATPNDIASPKIVQDGPFKVPQDISVRRKLQMEEEATIALRTRSKLSLSATSIEHIESSFIPPDDLPVGDVDDLWNQFLNECLNPAQSSKHEDDDETDPEYNVAADQDAHDDDEEALENSLVKISKKELNDLVNELFNVMPDVTNESVKTDGTQSSFDVSQERVSFVADNSLVQTRWEGKQEPISDEEAQQAKNNSSIENSTSSRRFSIGKTEPPDDDVTAVSVDNDRQMDKSVKQEPMYRRLAPKPMDISIQVQGISVLPWNSDESSVPPVLEHLQSNNETTVTRIRIDPNVKMLPDQILILQQQLRQHIQLATSNFLQLFVHPVHWSVAPSYKEYIEAFINISKKTDNSYADVCNLKPAWELVNSWEDSVSKETPENIKMVEFIQKEVERIRVCIRQNNYYKGEFDNTFKEVVSNSTVFLYPYLLPPTPYRSDVVKRNVYLKSEDELLVLGLDQFWDYVEMNPDIYKPQKVKNRTRWGLAACVKLLCTHMFPWCKPTTLLHHIHHARKIKGSPMANFFAKREVKPVQHKLLPFNPKMTLYEQPEHELPKSWVRYLAKSSKRFRSHLYKHSTIKSYGEPAEGVTVHMGKQITVPEKVPLPIHFTCDIPSFRQNVRPKQPSPTYENDKIDLQIRTNEQPIPNVIVPARMYSVVNTSTGALLVPMETNDSAKEPVTTVNEAVKEMTSQRREHCTCCVLLRNIVKTRQSIITEYFNVINSKGKTIKVCPCRQKKYPKVTNRLKMFISFYKNDASAAWDRLNMKIESKGGDKEDATSCDLNDCCSLADQAFVNNYQMRLNMRLVTRNFATKKRVYDLFSKFDPEVKSPIGLAKQVLRVFDVELVDMYKEFLGFLNAAQADILNKFRYYFVQTCLQDLIKKIDERVTDEEKRHCIFVKLHSLLSTTITACEMCTELLKTVKDDTDLAKYVFSLFPHRRIQSNKDTCQTQTEENAPEQNEHQLVSEHSEATSQIETIDDPPLSVSNYEADRIPSVNEEDVLSEPEEEVTAVKIETDDPNNEIHTAELTVTKTEVQEYNEKSNMSPVMMLEDEIKMEELDWRREEDKFILEVLKNSLSPEDRKEKSLLEIIEDDGVLKSLSDCLTDKSVTDIKSRVLYLLGILVRNNR